MEEIQPQISGESKMGAGRALILVVLCNLILLVIYAWFISVGTWTDWPTYTTAYDQLAAAFGHGHTWLDQRPAPELLALSDPYDPAQRRGIPYPLDFSLYEGRYYLYFGPAPAVLLLAGKLLFAGVIGDQYLVFLFTYAIALIQSVFIARIWIVFFPDVPPVLVATHILAAGLVGPFTPSLGRPNVYIVAVMAGQAFFLAGLYAAWEAQHGRSSPWKLVIASLLWVAAIASRITLMVPVGLISLLLILRFFQRSDQAGSRRSLFTGLLRLLLPLSLGAILLGWYDWVRFGSVLETGYRYALAGNLPLRKGQEPIFSAAYVVQNLRNYTLNAPMLHPAFPYLAPVRGTVTSVTSLISLPSLYSSQSITGLLYSAPLVILALVPSIHLLKSLRRLPLQDHTARSLRWLTAMLVAAFLGSFAVLLAYFWVAERFIADFLPGLLLLGTIGSWQVYRLLRRRWLGRIAYILVLGTLIAIPVLITSLLAISINADGFRQLNPVLWRQLSNLVRH